jgi:methylated-DNA-[protein]-cysteine S-methyltransferase
MTTPSPTVPPADFATPLLVGLPEQLFKQFTSSPFMIAVGLFILTMLIFGPYLKAKKKEKLQKERAEKRAQSSTGRRKSPASRSGGKGVDNGSLTLDHRSERATSQVSPSGGHRKHSSEASATEPSAVIHKVISSPVGNLTLVADAGVLSGVYHEGHAPEGTDFGVLGDAPILAEAERQMNEYFTGERVKFNLALKEDAPTFDRNVWTGISKIPYGETLSLEGLIESMGYKPGSSTYVSGAISRNRFAIVVPSHRVSPFKKHVGGSAEQDALLELEHK